MKIWDLKDAFDFAIGKNPLNDKQLIFFLGKEKSNEHYFFQLDNDKSCRVVLKTDGEFYPIEPLLEKFGLRENGRYSPKELLKWLIKFTYITPPKLLLDLVFKDEEKELENLREILANTDSRPTQEVLNKATYKLILTTRNNQTVFLIIKNFREGGDEELVCHILKKDNTANFDELFKNEKITLGREALEKFIKTINNVFDKLEDKLIRSKLKNGFFSITANLVLLKAKEITL